MGLLMPLSRRRARETVFYAESASVKVFRRPETFDSHAILRRPIMAAGLRDELAMGAARNIHYSGIVFHLRGGGAIRTAARPSLSGG